jgi:hypothetical protein
MGQADLYQWQLARILGFRAAKTIYRRRIMNPEVYRPDYIDRTKHPRWKPETAERIKDWEKGSKR